MKASAMRAAALFLAALCSAPAFGMDLKTGLDSLSAQLASQFGGQTRQKVAVMEFVDLDGQVNDLGKYLSEKLITNLFLTRKFTVIERNQLNKILSEQQLQVSGVIDGSTAKEIGRIAGVDVICTGSVTVFANSAEINARCIGTETGEIVAVGSVEVALDETLARLIGTGRAASAAGTSGSAAPAASAAAGDAYWEDFSRYSEGSVPPGWIGAQDFMVKKEGARFVLAPMRPIGNKNNFITIPDLRFPANFQLDIQFGVDRWQNGTTFSVYLGNVRFGLDYGDFDTMGTPFIGASKGDRGGFVKGGNKEVLLSLVVKGSIATLSVDGFQKVMTRLDAFAPGTALKLGASGSNMFNTFKLYRISVKKVE